MNLAIWITLSRFIITLFILFSFYRNSTPGYTIALLLFIVAIISDILDGFIARKLNQASNMGAKLDPLVDKIMIHSILFSLFYIGIYNPVVIFAVFFRDMIVDGLRNIISEYSGSYGSNVWGKAKFTFQSFSVSSGLIYCIDHTYEDCIWLANALLAVAFLLSIPGLRNIVSALMYGKIKQKLEPITASSPIRANVWHRTV